MKKTKTFSYEVPELELFSYRNLSIVHGETDGCDPEAPDQTSDECGEEPVSED